jgi:F-type H+-transporting ATPase subunit epsilon
VSEVSAPSVKGEFGVLPGHRPLLAALEHGGVKYVEGGKSRYAAVAPGFAEVGPDRVVLLVEHWVPASDIDTEDVRDELARAELKVKELLGQESTAEYEQARRDERWASVRLEVAKHQRDV